MSQDPKYVSATGHFEVTYISKYLNIFERKGVIFGGFGKPLGVKYMGHKLLRMYYDLCF